MTALLVAGLVAGCTSSESGGSTSKGDGDGAPPAAPTGVTASSSDSEVTLSWDAVSGAANYKLYWGNATGVTKESGNLIEDVTSPYAHEGRTNGTAYYYVATAENAAGESAESAEVGATPTVTAALPVITPAPYTATQMLDLVPTSISLGTVTALLPEASAAMGIVTIGTNSNYKAIVHDYAITQGGSNLYITGPSGEHAPISFSHSGTVNNTGNLFNNQAPAIAFPNNGLPATLAAGSWTIPIASINADFTAFEADSMHTIVYYKTVTDLRPTLKLNVFVVSGVNTNITDNASAEADLEIAGALSVLQNAYHLNAAVDIDLAISVKFITPSFDGSPDIIGTDAEMFGLMSSFPNPAVNDAMNIFVVTSIDNLGPGTSGVIGLALGLPGPFNHQGTAVSGTLAEYQGDGQGIMLGYILAHEFGHYLGLFHSSQTNDATTMIVEEDPISDTPVCTTALLLQAGGIDNCLDRHNLMFPYVCDPIVDINCDDPDVSQGQGNVVRYNPGVTPP